MTTTHTSRRDAASFLQSLKHGDDVVVTQDGREYAMTVSRTYQLADITYGDPDGGNVVVTLGPGRWSTTVSAGRVAEGFVAIRRAEEVDEEADLHLVGIVTTPGARYPFRAVCSCGWKSWGYVAAHAAQGMLTDHVSNVQPLMVEPEPGEFGCDECGAAPGQPCEWSCTSRPTPPSDAPLNVRATVRRPDGDTFVIFAGQVPTWLWDDDHTRELWKRQNRGSTLTAANIDPTARGYRVAFDAWDPQEADLV